jgi:hypothetical protein
MKEIIHKNIEYGNIITKYTSTCPFCFCTFSYQNEDIYINNFGAGEPLVQCPSCGKPFSAPTYPGLEVMNGRKI